MVKKIKKKTHSLTILMLKPHIKDITSAVKLNDLNKIRSLDIAGNIQGKLFFKQADNKKPDWISLFEPVVGNELNNLFSTGASVLFITQVETRFFAFIFGYGKFLLSPDSYEENFGLKVVLNAIDPEQVRSIDIQSLDAVPLNSRSQASVATNITDFGIDIEQDLIYAATGTPKIETLGKKIIGKDALKLSLPCNIEDIPNLLKNILSCYNSENYKENFSWVDNLTEVRTKTLIDKLDDLLVEKIKNKNFVKTWLAIPDIIEWFDVAGFKYQRPKQGELLDDINWESYLGFLANQSFSKDTFRKHFVYALSESTGQTKYKWTIYDCIYCEISFDDKDYSLNNGKWFKIDPDFLSNLNNTIKDIPISEIQLPVYFGNNESNYNKSVFNSNEQYYALMDKKNICYGGGHSKIEFCDLFTKDNHLIHVKKYAGSSVLSHLFSQGTIATRLFLSDSDFRKEVNKKLPKSHKITNPSQKPKASDFEVVYAIACDNKTDAGELPLFSKINLRNNFIQLQTYGVKVSLLFIPIKE